MKKWSLHTFACIVNAASVITFLGIMIFLFANEPAGISLNEVPFLLLFLLCFAIYLLADYWGIKLVKRYKENDKLSFTEGRIISAILFFHCIVQVVAGYLAIIFLYRIITTSFNFMRVEETPFAILALCIIFGFFSGLITFITTILLTKAIKKNHIAARKEIENIGNTDTV